MDKEQVADLINKVCIAQGELQRSMIWMKRLYDDLEILARELIVEPVDNGRK